jgi:hypothetical protein
MSLGYASSNSTSGSIASSEPYGPNSEMEPRGLPRPQTVVLCLVILCVGLCSRERGLRRDAVNSLPPPARAARRTGLGIRATSLRLGPIATTCDPPASAGRGPFPNPPMRLAYPPRSRRRSRFRTASMCRQCHLSRARFGVDCIGR